MRLGYLFAATSVGVQAANHTFAVWGDYGTGTDLQKEDATAINTYCAKYNCEFMLTVGDNFYNGPNTTSDPRFKSQFSDMYDTKVPFYICAGNHDYMGKLSAELEYTDDSRWTFPALNYTQAFPDLDLTVVYLDTCRSQPSYMKAPFGDCNGECAKQLADVGCTSSTYTDCWGAHNEWLDKTLKSIKTTWKFVLGHHPIDEGAMPTTAKVLADNGVQAYLAGHVHNLQHASDTNGVNYFISGAGAWVSPADKATTADKTLILPPTRGRDLYCPPGTPCYPLATNFTSDGPGFLSFEVDTTDNVMIGRFIKYTGEEVYSVTLRA